MKKDFKNGESHCHSLLPICCELPIPGGLMEGVVSEACGTAVASARGKAGRRAGNGDGNGGRGMGGKKGPTRSKAGRRASRQPRRLAGNLAEVGGGGIYPQLFPSFFVRFLSKFSRPSRSWMFSNTWFSFSHLGFSGGGGSSCS